ncbi:PEGA domain-containing protein [Enhygromyxa salina]|uniref:PEGA domain protein n=1 Tax=Enhygromyxa salina TaxID=215803 RepID=A0A2S9Y809_9BACT|nr:PEGA domain-containing protein [Enhygromyxa salina]PRQ01237.1 PEGA domain protein [Enhygromyxa salina]
MICAWLLACLTFAPPSEPAENLADDSASDLTPLDPPEDSARVKRSGPAYVDVLEPLPEELRSEDDARVLKDSAKAAFRDERFEDAIEFLAEAYRTYPYVTLLYSLGSAHRRAYERDGDAEHRRLAIRRYQQYLSAAPDAESADLAQNYLTSLLADRDLGDIELEAVTRILVSTTVEDATMRIDGGAPLPAPGVISIEPGPHEIVVRADGYHDFVRSFDVPEGTTFQVQAELEDMPGAVGVVGPKGAVVLLDGRVVGELPLAHPVEAESGPHVVSVTKNGYRPFSKDIVLVRNGQSSVRAALDVSNQRFTSFFFLGLGAVGVISSAVLIGLSVERQNRALVFDRQRKNAQLTTNEYNSYLELVDSRNALRTGAVFSGLGGAVLFVTGVALYVFDDPRLRPGGALARLSGGPVFGGGTTGVAASLRF